MDERGQLIPGRGGMRQELGSPSRDKVFLRVPPSPSSRISPSTSFSGRDFRGSGTHAMLANSQGYDSSSSDDQLSDTDSESRRQPMQPLPAAFLSLPTAADSDAFVAQQLPAGSRPRRPSRPDAWLPDDVPDGTLGGSSRLRVSSRSAGSGGSGGKVPGSSSSAEGAAAVGDWTVAEPADPSRLQEQQEEQQARGEQDEERQRQRLDDDADDEFFGLEYSGSVGSVGSESKLTYQQYMTAKRTEALRSSVSFNHHQQQQQQQQHQHHPQNQPDGASLSYSASAAAAAAAAAVDGAGLDEPQLPKYSRLIITKSEAEDSEETTESCGLLLEALHIRRRWLDTSASLNRSPSTGPTPPTPPPPLSPHLGAHPPQSQSPQQQPQPYQHHPLHPPPGPPLEPLAASGHRFKMRDGLFAVWAPPSPPSVAAAAEPDASAAAAAAGASSTAATAATSDDARAGRAPGAPAAPPDQQPQQQQQQQQPGAPVDGQQPQPEEEVSSLDDEEPLLRAPSLADYYRDLNRLLHICTAGPAKSMCFRRLRLLDAKFNLHILLNEEAELAMARLVPHRDFYNVHKVDTHVHHSSAMNHKKLLKFIKRKLKQAPDEHVIIRDGKQLTLREVFDSLNLSAYDLSVDTLDVHADNKMFHRFDRFNLKYSPCGQSRLREIFLKTDNFIKGRYLAELTQEIFSELMTARYQSAEYRISIYGRNPHEWDKLAAWVIDNKLQCANVRWMIQIPRLYGDFKELGMVSSFAQLLHNIFMPLFEVTNDPSSHPKLRLFLEQVSGFDCVDDESKPEKKVHNKYPTPELWDIPENPNYTYYSFYLAANLRVLNAFRKLRGLCTFTFRPHAGEAGEIDHLASSFLLAHGISHGINLRKSPVLQYLFYLEQIGIAMSPLSNNSLFLNYHRNPFPVFFARGLNVSLSTDDPLQFHYSSEPLIEEYSIAAQVWKLSSVDLCEIARNSVLQSGFTDGVKVHWLGRNYYLPGISGNDIHKTNVPNIRIAFRDESLRDEFYFLYEALRNRPTTLSFSPIIERLPLSKISEERKIEEAIAEREIETESV